MMKLFFVLMFSLFLGANVYVFFRLSKMVPVMWVRVLLITFGVLLMSCFVAFFLARDAFPASVLSFMYSVGTSWIFIFLYLFMVVLVADLLRMTHVFPIQEYFSKSWIGFFSVTGLVAIIMFLGYLKYENKVRVNLDISLNKEVSAQSNLKIVAISDMHLGFSIGREEFERWVKLINEEKPDLILMAGDIIDNSIQPLRQQHMEEVFRTMKSRYGIYACMGNHEYISGFKESMDFLKDAGITLLKDSAHLVNNSFYVVGRDDRASQARKATSEVIGRLDKTKPIIVLDHQPYDLEEVEKNGIDLQISGHTHHGQVWPISWITSAIYEKSHGYLQKGNSHIYVSSGIGLWGGKFRIGTQSEYVVINLQY